MLEYFGKYLVCASRNIEHIDMRCITSGASRVSQKGIPTPGKKNYYFFFTENERNMTGRGRLSLVYPLGSANNYIIRTKSMFDSGLNKSMAMTNNPTLLLINLNGGVMLPEGFSPSVLQVLRVASCRSITFSR